MVTGRLKSRLPRHACSSRCARSHSACAECERAQRDEHACLGSRDFSRPVTMQRPYADQGCFLSAEMGNTPGRSGLTRDREGEMKYISAAAWDAAGGRG